MLDKSWGGAIAEGSIATRRRYLLRRRFTVVGRSEKGALKTLRKTLLIRRPRWSARRKARAGHGEEK